MSFINRDSFVKAAADLKDAEENAINTKKLSSIEDAIQRRMGMAIRKDEPHLEVARSTEEWYMNPKEWEQLVKDLTGAGYTVVDNGYPEGARILVKW